MQMKRVIGWASVAALAVGGAALAADRQLFIKSKDTKEEYREKMKPR